MVLRGASGRSVRLLAALACVWLAGSVAGTPARADPRYPAPREDEWWFTTWDVQNQVWPLSQGEGTIVAVLDNGVQADIPELAGAVLPGVDLSGGGGDGRTDTDADGFGHGTGMATLIAGRGGPEHFLGLAPQAKILPIDFHGDSSALSSGIRYGVDHGAGVINISQAVSAPCWEDLQQAVGYALDHNVVVVAAAGNEGAEGNPSDSPADCAGVLAVGGIGVSGQSLVPWSGTERQPYVTVAAPAEGVGAVLRDGKFHTSSGGTSSSSALTSATVALIRSEYPDMPAREVVHRIIASCRDVGAAGKDQQTGFGTIRPGRALSGEGLSDAPDTFFAAYDGWKAAHDAASKPATAHAASSDSASSVPILPIAALGIPVLAFGTAVVVRRSRRKSTASRDLGL